MSTNYSRDFKGHSLGVEDTKVAINIRASLVAACEKIEQFLPPSREQSLAKTKIEEALFWANACIERASYDTFKSNEAVEKAFKV